MPLGDRSLVKKCFANSIVSRLYPYVESKKQAGGVNGSIVLQQAALERLAWVLLVEDKRSLSQNGFHKLPAADEVKLLLSYLGIDLKIPDRLTNLIQLANRQNWVDGPQAITEIRNAITLKGERGWLQAILRGVFLRRSLIWLSAIAPQLFKSLLHSLLQSPQT